jgi:hypothetical protein
MPRGRRCHRCHSNRLYHHHMPATPPPDAVGEQPPGHRSHVRERRATLYRLTQANFLRERAWPGFSRSTWRSSWVSSLCDLAIARYSG